MLMLAHHLLHMTAAVKCAYKSVLYSAARAVALTTATASPLRRFVISFTHWTMQRKGAGIGEPTAPDGKVDDDPLCLGIHARETPEERSLRKRVFVRDDLPWCAASAYHSQFVAHW